MRFFLVGLGGFFGAVLRYAISGWVHRLGPGTMFPAGTLVVNLLGCALLGFLAALAETRGLFSPDARALLFIGLLGGFTTFSTFGYETFELLRDGQAAPALLSIALHVVLGIGAVWLGHVCGQQL